MEPRELIPDIEEDASPPSGSGHRRFPASSFGPAYITIWHPDPDGDWHFYQDVPPREGCACFFGRALADVTRLPIETHWDGPQHLRIVLMGRIEWQLNLSSTLATRAMNLMGSVALEEPNSPGRNGGS
jgi:hypothetical protein